MAKLIPLLQFAEVCVKGYDSYQERSYGLERLKIEHQTSLAKEEFALRRMQEESRQLRDGYEHQERMLQMNIIGHLLQGKNTGEIHQMIALRFLRQVETFPEKETKTREPLLIQRDDV